MKFKSALICAIFLIALSAFGQTIQKKSAKYTSPSSGQAMYSAYCASCHGMDGKGNGPAASVSKVKPTDLTTLASKNSGTFPSHHVATVIESGEAALSHGGGMPTWKPVFLRLDQMNDADSFLRVKNLTSYVEGLQKN